MVQRANIFEVEQLNFSYNQEEQLFEGINLVIPRGCRTSFLGQNGCGKTTMLYLLSKGLKKQKGEILFEGKSIEKLAIKDFAKKVAMVHQKNNVPKDLTVEQLVAYGRTPHQSIFFSRKTKEDQEIIEKAMVFTDTYKLRERTAITLSSGQLQRVWIAMALAQDTDIIFLDEPTTYLDVRYQIKILKLIERLNKENKMTVVMVLHDINQALAYSDEIIALKSGKMVLQDKAEVFYNSSILQEIYQIDLPVIQNEDNKIIKTF